MSTPNNSDSTSVATLDFYWRPGCGFCMMLERGLKKRNVTFNKINIWDDQAAAAFVRSVADGNEVVPTISVAGQTMVNPSADQVTSLLSDVAPHLVS